MGILTVLMMNNGSVTALTAADFRQKRSVSWEKASSANMYWTCAFQHCFDASSLQDCAVALPLFLLRLAYANADHPNLPLNPLLEGIFRDISMVGSWHWTYVQSVFRHVRTQSLPIQTIVEGLSLIFLHPSHAPSNLCCAPFADVQTFFVISSQEEQNKGPLLGELSWTVIRCVFSQSSCLTWLGSWSAGNGNVILSGVPIILRSPAIQRKL